MAKPIPEAVVTDKLIADLLPAALIFAENEEHLDHARQRAKTILLETLTAAQQQWQAVACKACAGSGEMEVQMKINDVENDTTMVGCDACNGTGDQPMQQGGGDARAKLIEWMEDGGDWGDRHHGFHITRDEDWPQENSFIASWGEGDAERFTTLEEAQAWCQSVIDDYIRRFTRTAPPSAPVGECPDCTNGQQCDSCSRGEWASLEPVAPVGVERREQAIRQVNYILWMDGNGGCEPSAEWQAGYQAALAQQPAAVDSEPDCPHSALDGCDCYATQHQEPTT